MSETDDLNQAPDAPLPSLHNLTVREAIRAGGGSQVTVLEAMFGTSLRTMEVRALIPYLGRQFDGLPTGRTSFDPTMAPRSGGAAFNT